MFGGGIPVPNFQLRLIPEASQPQKSLCVPNLRKDVIWCIYYLCRGLKSQRKNSSTIDVLWINTLGLHRFIRGPRWLPLGHHQGFPCRTPVRSRTAKGRRSAAATVLCHGRRRPVSWNGSLSPAWLWSSTLDDVWHHFFRQKKVFQFWVFLLDLWGEEMKMSKKWQNAQGIHKDRWCRFLSNKTGRKPGGNWA